ncbi:hypothetical protein FRX31_015399 [Thalictrum thalictroides]|uniref:Uncharacterized protein n=1 Tax=Thalictrum thalictroides TaxID=46969 RepID=A0A7J6WDG2_THATH|nr:hypothetical protein FRX31_015399 [Thalictrum thalictroides]
MGWPKMMDAQLRIVVVISVYWKIGRWERVDNANIGKECDMRGGCRWPLQVVARGIVQDVDPLTDFGNRKLEEGNFKVYVNVVHDPNVQLPCPP